MNIDWFTLIAQVVNFLILVVLLKYLLYNPIVKAMDKREERISSRLSDAETKREEAEEKLDDYEKKLANLEKEREQTLASARDEAEERKKKLIAEAREEVEKLKEKWIQSIERDKKSAARKIRTETGSRVFEITRRLLSDLADESIEQRTVERFLDRFDDLGKEEREAFRESVRKADNSVTVRTSFELSPQMKKKVTERLRSSLTDDIDTEYEQDPELLFGIEVMADNNRIDWNANEYLSDLERIITDTLKRGTKELESAKSNAADEKETSPEKNEEENES